MKKILLPLLLAALLLMPPDAPAAPAPTVRIQHVVIIWLKHHANTNERGKLIEASKALKTIPGVASVSVGPVLPSNREGVMVDSTFDVALVMGFADQKALDAYVKSPAQQKAVKEIFEPLASRYVIFDFMVR